MIMDYTICKYREKFSFPYQNRRMFTMFCFHKKKKKKNNTALIIIGIVIGVAAAAVGGYFLFTKVLKDKIFKKKVVECGVAEECCDCETAEEAIVEDAPEAIEE